MGRGGESLNSSRFRVVDAVIGPSIVIASAKGIPENPEKAEEGPNCVPHDVNLRALGIGPLHGDFLDGNTPASKLQSSNFWRANRVRAASRVKHLNPHVKSLTDSLNSLRERRVKREPIFSLRKDWCRVIFAPWTLRVPMMTGIPRSNHSFIRSSSSGRVERSASMKRIQSPWPSTFPA